MPLKIAFVSEPPWGIRPAGCRDKKYGFVGGLPVKNPLKILVRLSEVQMSFLVGTMGGTHFSNPVFSQE